MGCKMLDNLMMASGLENAYCVPSIRQNALRYRVEFMSFLFPADSQGESSVVCKENYCVQRLLVRMDGWCCNQLHIVHICIRHPKGGETLCEWRLSSLSGTQACLLWLRHAWARIQEQCLRRRRAECECVWSTPEGIPVSPADRHSGAQHLRQEKVFP